MNNEKIVELSNDNYTEIKNIINYYQQTETDPLKIEAAFYLLSNLEFHYREESGELSNFRERIYNTSNQNIINYNTLDSILKTTFSHNKFSKVLDLERITFEEFKSNIDKSFEIRNFPWTRKLPYRIFREFILPNKIHNEDDVNWKGRVLEDYRDVLSGLHDSSSIVTVCVKVNECLMRQFNINARVKYGWAPSYDDYKILKTGTCSNAAYFTCMIMRSMGIPVAADFTPYWGNKNGGHEWNAIVLAGSKPLHFIGSESNPGMDKIEFTRSYLMKRKRPKVFRRTFEIQQNSLFMISPNKDSIPAVFNSPYFKDVTNEYMKTSTVKIEFKKPEKRKFCYLAVFNNNNWVITDWASVNDYRYSEFKNLGRGVLYLPVFYSGDELIPADDPFILNENGQVKVINENKKSSTAITLHAKYPEEASNLVSSGGRYELFYWSDKWISLGEKTANSNSLTYENAPEGALFWLRRLDAGSQERIFTYNNKQIWW